MILAVGAPRAFDHYWRYGYLSLSAQEGGHFLNWFYGCLASANPCAERGRIVEEMRPIVENRIAALGTNVDNPFTASAVARELAVERILSTPPQVIAVSMSVGMFRVLMQTGFYESFAQFRQPAHFISSMSGDSFLTRMGNFLVANKSNPFMWLWALAQAALIASRLIQLVGLVIGLQSRHIAAPRLFSWRRSVISLSLLGRWLARSIDCRLNHLYFCCLEWGGCGSMTFLFAHSRCGDRLTNDQISDIAVPTFFVILISALVLRWGYALTLYATMGDGGLIRLDSLDYLSYTRDFISGFAKGDTAGWQWLGNNLHMMPLFTWVLADVSRSVVRWGHCCMFWYKVLPILGPASSSIALLLNSTMASPFRPQSPPRSTLRRS